MAAVSTLIFDVDDTLYDIATGVTAARNGPVVQQFMIDHLNFPDATTAKELREEYFKKFHATAKALQVAEQEGRFPPPAPGTETKSPRFEPVEFANYLTENLDYGLLGGRKQGVVDDLKELKGKLKLIAFSNGPRNYVRRVLQELGFWDTVFSDETLFAVDDVLPYCKPEKEAFEIIFERCGIKDPSTCVMFEDSMKNIRQAKQLGMKTVLISGTDSQSASALESRPGDAPMDTDPAVDQTIVVIEDIRKTLPGLWEDTPIFP